MDESFAFCTANTYTLKMQWFFNDIIGFPKNIGVKTFVIASKMGPQIGSEFRKLRQDR